MTSPLRTLLDRVEQGEGADRTINWDIADAFGMVPAHRIVETGFDYDWYRKAGDTALWKANDSEGRSVSLWQPEDVTGSIDAVVSLVEKVLPGWDHGYESGDCVAFGKVWSQGRHDDTVVRGEARTPARAILAATLRAKIAQEERNA